jgi:hypothetical protein
MQRTKQADQAAAAAAASLAKQLTSSIDANTAQAQKHTAELHAASAAAVAAAARSELLHWKQQLRQSRMWHMRQCTRMMTAAALHAARGRDLQVGGGRGYELDEEYEEWEDNLPFELGRLQQHPQLMSHLIKEHQAVHERELAMYVPQPEQPSNNSSAWLRMHTNSSSIATWLGSGVSSLLGSKGSNSSSNESYGDEDAAWSIEDAELFGRAPVWETSMDTMTPEYAEVAAVVLQAEGRYDAGCAVWPPAMYDHRDSGCCRTLLSSTAVGSAGAASAGSAELLHAQQGAAGSSDVKWQMPLVQQQQSPASCSSVPEVQKMTAAAASAAPAAGEAQVVVSQNSKRHSMRPTSPVAEGHSSSSRRSSSPTTSSVARPVKMAAALPKLHSTSGLHGGKQASSSSGSAGTSSKLPHHKRNMSAIQEEDESAGGPAAAARHGVLGKQQQAEQSEKFAEIEAAGSGDEEQQVDCSAASDASLHYENVMAV